MVILCSKKALALGQFAVQPGLEPLRLTVLFLGLSFYQARPLLCRAQFGLCLGQIKTRALDRSFFCRAGELDSAEKRRRSSGLAIACAIDDLSKYFRLY